ncbi:M23 family metallopeptidase, partial [Cryptosporangium minutisporangium]
VKYFSKMLKKAKGDIKLTLQAYNFGGGFIPYALERGGYSKEVAAAFSAMMEEKTGWDRYGDINYVENVLRYFEGSAVAVGADPNSYGFIKPIDTKITSEYGTRIDPFTGLPNTHFGTDFSCNRSNPPIVAVKSGTVTRAGWQNPSNHSVGFGQRIYIDHGNGLITVYAHLSDISVKPGQTVSQGQQIGLCGTTGSSTGEHLHLELHQNGRKLNPRGRIF